ncbi:MAG TPA: hypothetical protein IAB23_12855 [Candidatus Scybalocola faecavium]|nr:hypothetical protein [Candidatus Scybalocola faecavium]
MEMLKDRKLEAQLTNMDCTKAILINELVINTFDFEKFKAIFNGTVLAEHQWIKIDYLMLPSGDAGAIFSGEIFTGNFIAASSNDYMDEKSGKVYQRVSKAILALGKVSFDVSNCIRDDLLNNEVKLSNIIMKLYKGEIYRFGINKE